MPGYGGGVGADTDGPNADYGEGMGTKGAAAADHSIGTVGGPGMGDAMSVEAFSKAISKALGQTRTEQEREMDDAYYGGTIDQSQLDDPTDDSPAYDPDAVNRQVYGAPQNLEDPQGTEEGLRQAELAAVGKRTVGAHPSRDIRIGMPMGVGRPTTTRDIENREVVDMYGRVAPIEDIEDPEERSLAYEMLGKLQKAAKEARTPLGKALNTIMGYGINAVPGMGQLNMIGKALKAGLAKAGFNVDPNIIGQAIRAAHEVSTQGPLGAGGTSIGARDDAFIEEFLRNIPASGYQEPWMKGLSERQIQYYLDRPSELEWVRNLYNQMNPSGGMGQ
jgi:hypothetical protein